MKATFYIVLSFFLLSIFISCDSSSQNEKQLIETVDSFAAKYFTWRFPEAMKYSDERFANELRFLASNVHGADLEFISNQQLTPTINSHILTLKDDSASVMLNVSNAIVMDTIGKAAHLHDTASYIITAVKKESWLITGQTKL